MTHPLASLTHSSTRWRTLQLVLYTSLSRLLFSPAFLSGISSQKSSAQILFGIESSTLTSRSCWSAFGIMLRGCWSKRVARRQASHGRRQPRSLIILSQCGSRLKSHMIWESWRKTGTAWCRHGLRGTSTIDSTVRNSIRRARIKRRKDSSAHSLYLHYGMVSTQDTMRHSFNGHSSFKLPSISIVLRLMDRRSSSRSRS